MSDTISTPRAAWTRCNACQQKVENDRHEINIHKLNCPHRLQLQIQGLAKEFKKLRKEFDSLDEQLAADPDVDPDAVAPWPDDEDDDLADVDTDEADAFDIAQARTDAETALGVTPATITPIA